ncbi:hypothetical protein CWI38_0012p0040 [Hamiltosporidium tvaerminnensis]|uniref:Uncharacterized protein n=1 Tax=Hamiltosporidium tvaerminnensis TaxID=1176355 RepID=A0A4Q9M4G1_9MICR|nr:hypothetical protein CWI38_0012p0040 [Hamiltosporidium tvaerminnensis]
MGFEPRDKQFYVIFKVEMYSGRAESVCQHCNNHSVQEILYNEYVEIRVDFRIKTETDIRILDKRTNKMTPSEIGFTSQDSLQIVQTQKLRNYDLLANGLGIFYKLYGIVTKYHNMYIKRLQIPINLEVYIQLIVLKKTVQTISFDRQRGLDVILGAEMYKQPTSSLKQVDKEEDSVKAENTINIIPLIKMAVGLRGKDRSELKYTDYPQYKHLRTTRRYAYLFVTAFYFHTSNFLCKNSEIRSSLPIDMERLFSIKGLDATLSQNL